MVYGIEQGIEDLVKNRELSRTRYYWLVPRDYTWNTIYNLECKFTPLQITPAIYVSPSHTFTTFTTVKIKEKKGSKINTLLIIWGFYDSGKRGNIMTNFVI